MNGAGGGLSGHRDYPKFGNNDPRADEIAVQVVKMFMNKISKCPPTGTASHPLHSDHHLQRGIRQENRFHAGRPQAGRAFRSRSQSYARPGSKRLHRLHVVGGKAPYDYSEDGISYTLYRTGSFRQEHDEKAANLIGLLDGYFKEGGHHINVNVLNRDVLLDAMEHPELYPQLTIRVSGYAVNFIKLSREQQLDVISRTFHDRF